MTETQPPREEFEKHAALKPLSWSQVILLFAIPTAGLFLSLYWLQPFLESEGCSPFASFSTAFTIPFGLMFIAALVAFWLEGNPLTWQAFKRRYRLEWTGGEGFAGLRLFGFSILTYFLLRAGTLVLISEGIVNLPTGIPALLDPRQNLAIEAIYGGSLRGQWSVLALSLTELGFNVFGEELWWRGFILPRQEAALGRYTWVAHGVLWALFHAFKFWEIPALLPATLAFAYIAQRTKSTWPGILAHLGLNGFDSIALLFYVAL
jgi:membrane protease YdiL (CAAX protease family)